MTDSPGSSEPTTIYRHPLAYLIGMQGVALLRSFAGDPQSERDVVDARLAEIRTLLEVGDPLGDPATVPRLTTSDGYDGWSVDYDEPGNGLIDHETPIVRRMLDALPVGVALDAACGTGRHAAYLSSLGHQVIGVDASPGMLERAQAKVPDAEFHLAELDHLPLPDDHVDLVVCALALTHVADLEPVFAELARVLKPGGHLITSDVRGFMICAERYPLIQTAPDGTSGYILGWSHLTSSYLNAGLAVGLQPRSCDEPRYAELLGPDTTREDVPPGTVPNEWALHGWAVDATNAAYRGQPGSILRHFQLADT